MKRSLGFITLLAIVSITVVICLFPGCAFDDMTLYNKAIRDRFFSDFPPVEDPSNPVRLGINLGEVSDYSTEFFWVDIMPYMRVEGEIAGGAPDFSAAQFDTDVKRLRSKHCRSDIGITSWSDPTRAGAIVTLSRTGY